MLNKIAIMGAMLAGAVAYLNIERRPETLANTMPTQPSPPIRLDASGAIIVEHSPASRATPATPGTVSDPMAPPPLD